MRYVLARFKQEQREQAYRFYVSDALRLISKNTAVLVQGGYMDMRLYDLIHPKQADTRTADDVISHIKQGLNKLGGGKVESI